MSELTPLSGVKRKSDLGRSSQLLDPKQVSGYLISGSPRDFFHKDLSADLNDLPASYDECTSSKWRVSHGPKDQSNTMGRLPCIGILFRLAFP